MSEPGPLGITVGTLWVGNVSKMQSCREAENEIIQVKIQSEVLFTSLPPPGTPPRELLRETRTEEGLPKETGVMVAPWA